MLAPGASCRVRLALYPLLMKKHLLLLLTFSLLTLLVTACLTESQPETPMLVRYVDGAAHVLDATTPRGELLLQTAAGLLASADSTNRLVVTDNLIAQIKAGAALEVQFTEVQTATLAFNQQTVYFTALLFPLSGGRAGAVFFRGVYAQDVADPPPDYAAADAGLYVVTNSQAVSTLLALLDEE